jgi:hypothetical protein
VFFVSECLKLDNVGHAADVDGTLDRLADLDGLDRTSSREAEGTPKATLGAAALASDNAPRGVIAVAVASIDLPAVHIATLRGEHSFSLAEHSLSFLHL